MCNNCFNGCGCNHDNGGNCDFNNRRCGCNDNCDCDFGCGCGFGTFAFAQAARINQRILARRACEDRAAMQYLRAISCGCRRCW